MSADMNNAIFQTGKSDASQQLKWYVNATLRLTTNQQPQHCDQEQLGHHLLFHEQGGLKVFEEVVC